MSAGGVLFLDGHYLYQYYQVLTVQHVCLHYRLIIIIAIEMCCVHYYVTPGVKVEDFKADLNVTSLGQITDPSVQFSDIGLKLVVADVSLVTSDFKLTRLDDLNIHGDDSYISIEFAGTITAVLFSVSAYPV